MKKRFCYLQMNRERTQLKSLGNALLRYRLNNTSFYANYTALRSSIVNDVASIVYLVRGFQVYYLQTTTK